MVSPTLTRMTGPGTVPPNVQTFWTKPVGDGHLLLGHDQIDVVDLALEACRGGRVVDDGRRRRRIRLDVRHRRGAAVVVVVARAAGAVRGRPGDDDRADHAALLVPGDRAQERQAAGRHVDLDGRGRSGLGDRLLAVREGDVMRDLAGVGQLDRVAPGGGTDGWPA